MKTTPVRDAPVFIVGPPRSGTTLTARILNRHSRVFMPGETHFFPDIMARAAELGDPTDPSARVRIKARLRDLYDRYNEPTDQRRIDALVEEGRFDACLDEAGGSYCGLLDRFMRMQMEHQGKHRWGNNVPKDVFYVDQILSCFPDARFVYCVRDPRDFLLSYKNKWKATSPEHVERIRALYHPVVTTLLWKYTMRLLPSLRASIPNDQLLISRYEALVADPQGAVRTWCDFLGESFEPTMLDVEFSNTSAVGNRTGIYASSVSRWRKNLEPEDAWIGQQFAARELESAGYAREALRPNWLRIAGLLLTTPIGLWRALKANRSTQGPIIPYVMRRLGIRVRAAK